MGLPRKRFPPPNVPFSRPSEANTEFLRKCSPKPPNVPTSLPLGANMDFLPKRSLKPNVPLSRPSEANVDFPCKPSPKPPRLNSPFFPQSKSADPIMEFRRRSSPTPSSKSSSQASVLSEGTDLNEKILLSGSPPIWSPCIARDSFSKEDKVGAKLVQSETFPRKAAVRNQKFDNDSPSPMAYRANRALFSPDCIHPQPHNEPRVEKSRSDIWSPQLERDWSPELPRQLSPDHPPGTSASLSHSGASLPAISLAKYDGSPESRPLLDDWSPNTDWTTQSTTWSASPDPWLEGGQAPASWTSPSIVKVCCKCHTKIGDHKNEIDPLATRSSLPRIPRPPKRADIPQRKLFATDAEPMVSSGEESVSGLVSIDSLLASYSEKEEIVPSPSAPLTSSRYLEHLDFLQTRVTDK